MFTKKSQQGQTIVMIVFVIIGVFGLIALTVDGGMAYMDRRHAQGAVDSAAWAGGLANTKGNLGDINGDGKDDPDVAAITQAAMDIANANTYFNNGTRSDVVVNVEEDTSGICPPQASPNVLITVQINSYVKTFFGPIIGVETVTNRVQAQTRACGTYDLQLFNGSAIVGLGLGGTAHCAFDSSTGNATWSIHGSGISSNNCAVGFVGKDNVNLNGNCVSAPGSVSFGASAPTCAGAAQTYDRDYVDSIMPRNPCAGPITNGVYEGGGLVPSAGQMTFTNGVYCISDVEGQFGQTIHDDIKLTNATLYITDPSFDLKFAGGGGNEPGFVGTPTTTGEYSSLLIVVQPPASTSDWCSAFNDNNSQTLLYRGNGSGDSYGTVLAPSACVDLRGNANSDVHGQIVGNLVSANGTADAEIWYEVDSNYQPPQDPNISLVK
ncbi:MAG: hypothetical protein Fur002_04350 [Anaerolineales bacterium]